MQNKKKTLIKLLNGSVEDILTLTTIMQETDLFDEAGYVDTEFVTNVLLCVNRHVDAVAKLMTSFNTLMGCEQVENIGNKKTNTGAKWSVEQILQNCRLEDNIIKFPNVQFNKNSYAEAKKWIKEAGGQWVGGKTQGFTFPFDATRVFSILHQGKRCNLQKEFQFFSTPSEIADLLVGYAGGITSTDNILEPSAGTGAIIDAIHRANPDVVVDCFELMPENKEILIKKTNINLIGDDFYSAPTKSLEGKYNKIIANPPFSSNQDVKHVLKMYEILKPGGTLAVIMSRHWMFSSDRLCVSFRNWIERISAKEYAIPEGAFKDSNTNVATIALVINKE